MTPQKAMEDGLTGLFVPLFPKPQSQLFKFAPEPAASVWLGSSLSWFDHAQPSPLFPIASTGHPSIAWRQRSSSSGVVGCLKT